VPFEVSWQSVPGRDENWKIETIANTSEAAFMQEQENIFAGATNTLINMISLRSMHFKEPLKNLETGLKIYEEPIKDPDRDKHIDALLDGMYVLVADTAEGIGADYSAFSIFRVDQYPYTQVCTFRNNLISPSAGYPDYIVEMAKYFNNAYVLIETNSVGLQVANVIYQDLEYENILMAEMKGKKGQNISGGYKRGAYFGVKTSKLVKKLGCKTLQDLIHNTKLVIQDFDTIQELSTFVKVNDSFKAEPGCNDDMAMTLVLFAWLTTQKYFKELHSLTLRENLYRDQIREVYDQLAPIGFFDTNSINNKFGDSFIDEEGLVWTKV
jgi:hypothetical protein